MTQAAWITDLSRQLDSAIGRFIEYYNDEC